ncbi:hypothetical protein KY290_022471 [Solanum tuberosum]|uniref:Uncharacterized protein n=1 Tax=Solanum tuberosum TaxID=4113 RepID=A0ABQ7V6I6_SOLTU|nr:hypothetical protein KY284_021368 [Solanum tuberosum]KAH0758978.1 hypothetical protein KY290_022471 [Solanum tuberosum]
MLRTAAEGKVKSHKQSCKLKEGLGPHETLLSQEVENPSSFDFSIPIPEDSPSTPVCGAGEMDESFSSQTEITASYVPPSDEVLVYSPTPVLSGDLPEGKDPDSCILTTGAELVVVQSLTSLRGDTQPILLDQGLRSPDQVSHRSELIFDQTPKSFDVGSDKEKEKEILLKWNSRGMRGGNRSQEYVLELETIKDTRQRKGKGKLVLTHPKGDKKKYVTRSETQKVMGSVIVASKAQTERNRKMMRKGVEREQPAFAPLSIENSETESKDAAKYVAKRKREAEEEGVKSKENQKGGKKSPAKRVTVAK